MMSDTNSLKGDKITRQGSRFYSLLKNLSNSFQSLKSLHSKVSENDRLSDIETESKYSSITDLDILLNRRPWIDDDENDVGTSKYFSLNSYPLDQASIILIEKTIKREKIILANRKNRIQKLIKFLKSFNFLIFISTTVFWIIL